MMTHNTAQIGRRGVLGLFVPLVVGAALWRPAWAAAADGDSPTAPIEQLDNALLAAMKASDAGQFDGRYRTLAPVIDQVFDLDAVLGASVGLSWATMAEAQKAALGTAFRSLHDLQLRVEFQ